MSILWPVLHQQMDKSAAGSVGFQRTGAFGPQGDALASGVRQTVADGLKTARDCGFGRCHIDLLLERARLHLLSGEPPAALDDLRTALDDGVHGDPQTGQPELLAATHAECGYAFRSQGTGRVAEDSREGAKARRAERLSK